MEYGTWLLTRITRHIAAFQVLDDKVLVSCRDGFPSGDVLASVTMVIPKESQLHCLVSRWLRATPVKTTVLSDRNVLCQLQQTRDLLMTRKGCSWAQLFHSTARVNIFYTRIRIFSESSHSRYRFRHVTLTISYLSHTHINFVLFSKISTTLN